MKMSHRGLSVLAGTTLLLGACGAHRPQAPAFTVSGHAAIADRVDVA